MIRRVAEILIVGIIMTGVSFAEESDKATRSTMMNEQDISKSTIHLISDPAAWVTWAARSEIEPDFEAKAGGGPNGQPVLMVSSNGNPIACGCWRRPLPALKQGQRYRIEVAFQADGVSIPAHSVWAIVVKGNAGFYNELDYVGEQDGWERVAAVIEPSKDMDDLSLCLFLAKAANGSVRWSDAQLTNITDVPVKPRTAYLAAISGKPYKPASPEDCMDFYCKQLDEIGPKGVDLVCLPEVINTDGVAGDRSKLAEPIPGPSSKRLAEKARKYGMYVCASLSEREGDRIYNTGIIIDRSGAIIGKYRKTHLTISELLLSGKMPGDTYPIFQTDIGAIGYMICYDNHYPEVARTLAVKGADIIVFSNMGDGREGGTLWETYIRTRALDNQVHIVAAVNGGRSCIVSPRGELLDINDKTPGAIASAHCDLDASVCDFTGRPIRKRYLRMRRNDTFAPLTGHFWEAKKP